MEDEPYHGMMQPKSAKEVLEKAIKESGLRYNKDKPKMSLIDSYALEELAKVLTAGAVKYAKHNWRKGLSIEECLDSLNRHYLDLNNPDKSDLDPETQINHAFHIMCNAMFIGWLLKYKPECDDRYKGLSTENAALAAKDNGQQISGTLDGEPVTGTLTSLDGQVQTLTITHKQELPSIPKGV